MRISIIRFIAAIFLSGIAASLYSIDFQEVTSAFTRKIRRVTLDNGLRLVMMKRENSPTVALYIKFRVGAVDETPEEAGSAHMLEHMLFKGTPNVGTTDYSREKKYQDQIRAWGRILDQHRLEARDLQRAGKSVPEDLKRKISVFQDRMNLLQKQQMEFIVKNEDSFIYSQNGETGFNAYTNQDVTNYQIELPANRMEVWAKMESDRLKNPVLREFYTERDVVIEERRMRTDNSGKGVLFERFLETAFSEHPYRKPVIGFASSLPYLDLAETEDFFYKHYTPDNMVISVVGDIDFADTEKLVRKYFGDIKRKSHRDIIRSTAVYHSGKRTLSVKYPGGPLFIMGWKKPPVPHPDNASFEILSSLLADGPDSRLYARLVLEEKLALNVQAWNGFPGERYDNLFMIFCTLNSSADYEKVEKIISEEIARISKGETGNDVLLKLKKKSIADFFRGMDKNSSFADYLSYYEVITGDWKDLFSLYSQIEQVTPADLQKIAGKYLTEDNLTTGRLVKADEK